MMVKRMDVISKDGAKITPDIMMVIYMDEMVGRLADLDNKINNIQQLMNQETTDGTLDSVEIAIIGGSKTEISIHKKWFEYTLFNDGPDPVYIVSEKREVSDVPINMGDQVAGKAKRGSTKSVWVRCDNGENATVRAIFKF